MLRNCRISGAAVRRHVAQPCALRLTARSASTSTAAAPSVLVTGATGQIGIELVAALRKRYGSGNVLATDVKVAPAAMQAGGPWAYLDVTDGAALARLVVEHRVTTIVHLASLLSAVGERNPQLAMRVNARGAENVLEAAAVHGLKVFAPSTIAVFGPTTPRYATPNSTILRPTTIYGITKIYGELLGEYYCSKFGVDFRSLRYPGIISNTALPGGGTTDYAVDIFYEALKKQSYECFLKADTPLPMMYLEDCIRGTIELMEAPAASLSTRVYNMTAVSFTPAELAASIKTRMPGFSIRYAPDFRQAIADSWPASIDDSLARKDWGWAPQYGLPEITDDMLTKLSARLGLPIATTTSAAAAKKGTVRMSTV